MVEINRFAICFLSVIRFPLTFKWMREGGWFFFAFYFSDCFPDSFKFSFWCRWRTEALPWCFRLSFKCMSERRIGSSTTRPRSFVHLQSGLAQCPGVGRSRPWLPGGSLGTGRYRSGTARNTHNRTDSLNWSVPRNPGLLCVTYHRLYWVFSC